MTRLLVGLPYCKLYRVLGRILVNGLTCMTGRDMNILKLTLEFARSMVRAARFTKECPRFLKPYVLHKLCQSRSRSSRWIYSAPPRFLTYSGRYVSRYLTRSDVFLASGHKHWGPEVQKRMQLVSQYGPDYPEKPVRAPALRRSGRLHAYHSS